MKYCKLISTVDEFVDCFGFRELFSRKPPMFVSKFVSYIRIEDFFFHLQSEPVFCALAVHSNHDYDEEENEMLLSPNVEFQGAFAINLPNVKRLIQLGADISDGDYHILKWACEKHDFLLMEYLIDNFPDCMTIDALICAIFHGKFDLIRKIMKRGVVLKNHVGALIRAALMGGQLNIAFGFVRKFYQSIDKLTASYAARHGDLSILEIIFNNHAFEIKELEFIARSVDCLENMRYILERFPNLNINNILQSSYNWEMIVLLSDFIQKSNAACTRKTVTFKETP